MRREKEELREGRMEIGEIRMIDSMKKKREGLK
jgi:hypothetical protein